MTAPTIAVRPTLSGPTTASELARRSHARPRVPVHEPRLSRCAALRAVALREDETRCDSSRTRPCPERPGRDRRELSAARSRTLYGASKLAAELLIAEYRDGVRAADGHRSLRGLGRPMADGQGRSRRVQPLDARPSLPAPARATSASVAPASRCATCCTSMTCSGCSTSNSTPPTTGTANRQRRRRGRLLAVAGWRRRRCAPS